MGLSIRQQADEGIFRRLAQDIGANFAHDPLSQTAPLMCRQHCDVDNLIEAAAVADDAPHAHGFALSFALVNNLHGEQAPGQAARGTVSAARVHAGFAAKPHIGLDFGRLENQSICVVIMQAVSVVIMTDVVIHNVGSILVSFGGRTLSVPSPCDRCLFINQRGVLDVAFSNGTNSHNSGASTQR